MFVRFQKFKNPDEDVIINSGHIIGFSKFTELGVSGTELTMTDGDIIRVYNDIDYVADILNNPATNVLRG